MRCKNKLIPYFFAVVSLLLFFLWQPNAVFAEYIWTNISTAFPISYNLNWQKVDSSSDGTYEIAAVFGGRLYISSDHGTTWTETRPAGDYNLNWWAVSSNNSGSRLIAAINDATSGSIYSSSDHGANWTDITPSQAISRGWQNIASNSDGSRLVAVVYGGRIYTSSDYGASWTETQPAGDVNQNWRPVASSADGSRLIVGASTGRLYISSNYGASWTETQPAGAVSKSWTGIASSADGSHLIASVFGGRLYISSNYGASWTETQPAGNTNQNWWGVASNSDGSYLLAGMSSGSLYFSSNYGATWTEVKPAGDATTYWRSISISNNSSQIIALNYQGRMYISYDSGVTWTSPEINNYSLNWKSSAISNDGSRLVAGVAPGRLYRSSDYGASWTETQPAGNIDKSWYGLSSNNDGSRLVAGANPGRLYLSSDYGASWTETQPAGNTNQNWRTAIASNSTGSYLLAGVYSSGSLYLSVNYGANWNAISSLGSKSWKCAAISDDGSHMIVGVNGGRLHVSSDYGASWTETQPAGNTNQNWYDCDLNEDGSKLVAGASGGRLYVSHNYGSTWTEVQPAGDINTNWVRSVFSSTGDSILAENQKRLYFSSDAGDTWRELSPDGDVNRMWEVVAISSQGSRILAGILGGNIYAGVNDITPPVITLLGSSSISINRGSTYVDAGTTALDDYSGDLTNSITINNPVNINVAGIYTITYNVSDSVGNHATQVTRTVHVLDVTPPVLTLLGPNSVAINPGQSYTDEGAVAIDDNDGNITSSISVFNPLDINTVGTYDIIYSVTDSSGNTNRITRVVHVNAPGYLPQTSYQTPAQLVMSSQSSSTPGGSAVSTPIFTINDNLPFTTSNPTVTLKFNNFNNPLITKLAISTSTDFTTSSLINYTPTYSYNLCGNNNPVSNSTATTTANCPNGPYTIYAKYYTDYGQNTLAGPLNINLDRGASSATVLLPKDTVSPISTSTAPVSPSNPSSSLASRLSGRILLQVQDKGQAWYVNPTDSKRYSLGSPDNAFSLMRELALGISNDTFNSFKNNTAPKRLSGRILLNVQDFGKAYYVNPTNLKLYYLGRPADAFSVMRTLGLGVTNEDLNKIFEN